MRITTFGRAESIVSQGTKGEVLCPEVKSGQVISNTSKQIFQGKEKLLLQLLSRFSHVQLKATL